MKNLSTTFLILLITVYFSFGQTPGGIPVTDIAYWLRADEGITLSGSDVSNWMDWSGNANDAAPGTAPEFISINANLNDQPTLSFLGENLLIGNSTSINDGNQAAKTMVIVFRSPGSIVNGQELIYEQGGGTNGLIFYIEGDGATMDLNMGVYTGDGANYNFESIAITANTNYMATLTFEAASLEGYVANTATGLTSTIATPSGDPTNPLLSHTGDIRIGNNTGDNRGIGTTVSTNSDFTGDIAELIQYNRVLTSIELDAVANYLSSKYDMSITNDRYDGDLVGSGDFDYDVALIGHDGTTSQTTARGDLLTITESTVTSGEYLLWGHNDATASDLTGDYNGDTNNGSARIWAVEETGAVATVSISIAASALPAVNAIIVDNNADLSSPEQIVMLTQGTDLTVDVDFTDDAISYFSFVQFPEIAVSGNGVDIADGETVFGLNDDRDFAAQDVNVGSGTNTFTIDNLGNAELTIASVVLSNTTDFSIVSAPASIAALSSASLEIQFDPASIGNLSSTVTINSNDGDEAVFDFTIQGDGAALAEIQVSGNATNIGDGDITPDASDDTFFGNSADTPIDKVFTISNDAGASSSLTITTPVATSGSATFTVVAQPATSVAPGLSTTFTVRYTPAGMSTSEVATISITNSDTDENTFDFNVEATSLSGPGGLSNDLTFWFKAGDGVESSNGVAANNNDPLEYWRDQSPLGNDAIESDLAERPTWDNTNTINGNPVVTFDGTNDHMAISNLVYGDVSTLNEMTIYAIAQTTQDSDGIIVSYDRSSFFRFSVNNANNFRLGSNQGTTTTDFSSTGASAGNGAPHIIGADFDGVTTGDQRLFYDGALNSTLNTGTGFLGNTSELPRYGFISENSEATTFDGTKNNSERFTGDIAEIIYFESVLSATERQRVESYLALKYGLTLSTDTDGDAVVLEAGEGDYLDADGSIVWDADVNATYHNQVAGIANDANSGLDQSTSQSVLSGSILSMTDASLADKEYIVWGHNNSGISSKLSNNSTFRNELQRVWKVEITSGTNNVDQLAFDLTNLSVQPLEVGDIGLLIDDNETFSSPAEVAAGSWSGNVVTFDNVDFSAFAGDLYITVAYNLPIPGGVADNLTLWFRADAGIEEAAGNAAEDNDFVQYWRDQSGNSYDGQQNSNANQPIYDATNTLNTHPVLNFEAASRFTIRDLFYDQSTNTLDNLSIYAVTKSSQTDEGIIVSFDRSAFFRFALNLDDIANFGLGTTESGAIDDDNASSTASDGNVHLIQGAYDGTTGQKDLFLDGTNVSSAIASHGPGSLGNAAEIPRYGYINANSEETTFSANGAGGQGGFVGDIAEIVFFESALGATENVQVASYLALKYGITLSGDYLSSTGATVWNNATNTGYTNMIAGVALDNNGSLNQTQSQSENAASILSIMNSSLADGDYIIFGNDNADLSLVTSGTGSLDARFNRIWKFQISGSSTVADLAFDLSSVVINPAASGNYRLLLDDNAAFSSPQEISATSLNDDVLMFDAVNLAGETYMVLALDPDLDNDGIADATDIDDDNDGILDADEGNGVTDTDGDGIVDARDLDSDNDGVGDLYESGAEGAGTALATLDANNDGMIDTGNAGANGFDDRLETTADNGILAYTISDSDGEGILDFRDLDSDNNGISDLVEGGRNTAVDTDDDGVFEGGDDDEDGVPDEIDTDNTTYGAILIALDTDGDLIPDIRELDNDNDGTEDIDAIGLTDTTPDDGRLDDTTDVDMDGVMASRDDNDNAFGFINISSLVNGTGTDWYSYRSGDWTDPDNWTTDPSGTTRVNPGSLYPNELNENVTILNGDVMTLSFDGLIVSSMTVNSGGILDVGTTINHSFTTIAGEGTIRLASDDFPSGDITAFIATSGGTVEYIDQSPVADYQLSTARTFNNMVVNLASNKVVLKADYNLNTDLTITSGTLQVNDDTGDSFIDNTIPLSLTVNGDLTVAAAGSLTVGNTDASSEIGASGIFTFHELEVLGDFENNGSVVLTNLGSTSISDGRYRDKYPTAADDDNNTGSNDIPSNEFGVVELLFTNALEDQLVTLNGTTDLYRIEVNKGTSQTFQVEINANSTSNFRLLGRIAMVQSDNSSDNPNIENHRALGLEAGILKLGENIEIVQIAREDLIGAEAGTQEGNVNYIIDLDAQLWLAANASIVRENEWGIHPFGKLKVSDQASLTFTGTGQRTILVDNQGVYEQTGGTVDVTQFRNKTGSDGAPRGSFIMTGGILNVGSGGASDDSHAVFSIPWQDQNLILKAANPAEPPIINLTLDGNRGKDNAAVQIGVKEGNYEIGESAFNIIHTSNTDYKFISSAPLYNLTYNGSSTTAELIIDDVPDANGDFIAGGGVASDNNTVVIASPAEDAKPLTLLNDLIITDGRFDANDHDITIGNIMTIASGAEYNPGTNTTLFNGLSAVERINVSGTTPLVGGGFYNLSFSGNGTEKEFGGDLSTIVVLNDLTIGSGVTMDDNGKVLQVNGDIQNSGIHETNHTSPGRIEIVGGSASHEIGGDGSGRFKILTINDGLNGVSFTANQQVDSVLNLTTGVLDINTYGLTISSTATDPIRDDVGGTSNFSTTRMIQTSGNASDGGLQYYFDGLAADPVATLFPLGTNANAVIRYTPITMDLSGVADDGYVVISLADGELLTTEQTGGNILSYYWRSNNSGFGVAPTVTYAFTYDASDDDAMDEANYVPGKVLDESPFTRSSEVQANVNTTANVITFDSNGGGGFTLEDANYTAGLAARFIGAPTIYYSRRHESSNQQQWENFDAVSGTYTNWSLTGHDGVAAASFPGASDVVIIGKGQINDAMDGDASDDTGFDNVNTRHQMTTNGSRTVAEIIFDSNPAATTIGNNLSRIRLNDTSYDLTAGKISGHGELMISVTDTDESVVTADLGDFVETDTSSVFYDVRSGGSVVISNLTAFPGVRIFGNDNNPNVSFSNDITAASMLIDRTSTLELRSNITVAGDVRIGNNLEGHLSFPNDGTNNTLTIGGDLLATSGDPNTITTENAGTDVHTVSVAGNITVDAITAFSLTSATGTQTQLEVAGTGDHAFSNTTGVDAQFYRLIMNKGTGQSSTFSFNNTFTLSGTNDGTTKSLELQSGTLILNDAAIDLDLNAGNGDFTIPSTAGLNVQAGTVRMTASGTGTGNGMRLDGKLTVSGGDVLLTGGSNFVEYGTGGSSEIEISGGNFLVGAQLRRNILSDDGVLNYTQTAGTALFGVNDAPTDSRGVFEIVNTGTAGTSSFNLSGAATVFAIVNGQASPDLGSFYIGSEVAVNATTDPFIDFGFNATVAGVLVQNDANEAYAINASSPLPNIRIDDAGYNDPILNMIIQPLTVTNDIRILNGGTLTANSIDLNVNGGFVNDGTYTPGTNVTTFGGSAQQISGTTNSTFYDLNVDVTTSLTLSNAITVTNDLSINSGLLDDNGSVLSLFGNLDVTTEHVSSGTGGINMVGTSQQSINLPDGAAEIDYLVINNAENVTLSDNLGVAVNLTIDDELALDNGLFQIGDNRVFFDADAAITTSSGFDASRMISVNGVKKSDGVEKAFAAGVDAVAFTIPVGTPDKYTPVVLDVDGSDDSGSILIKPIDAIHPSATGVDALNYYWVVTTNPTTVSNFLGSISFQYLESDANNAGQNESDWENNAARLISPNWFKPSDNLVNISSNVMTFLQSDLSSFGGTTFDGEFTIGNDIPDQLAAYISNTTGSWNTVAIWDIDRDGDGIYDEAVDDAPLDELPQPGSTVIVDAGHTVDMSASTDNDQNVFSVQIDGVLDINDSDGHNFGEVLGNGTLRISNATIPGGNYSSFFTTTGGILDLSGSTSYTVSPDFGNGLRGLIVSGGGVKTLPLIAINIGTSGILVQGGTTLENSINNNNISVAGTIDVEDGIFKTGSSAVTLTATNVTVRTNGTLTSVGAIMNVSNDLTLEGGTMNAGTGTLSIGGILEKGPTNIFNNDNGTVAFNGTTAQEIRGDFTSQPLYNLTVNKGAEHLILANDAKVYVLNTLSMDKGNVRTGALNAAFRLNKGVGSVGSSVGFVDGPLQVLLSDDDRFTFPVGKGPGKKTIEIKVEDGSSSMNPLVWEVEYYNTDPNAHASTKNPGIDRSMIETNTNPDEQVQEINNQEYWRIDTKGGTSAIETLTMDISNIGITTDDINDQKLQVVYWDNSTDEWGQLGGVSSGAPTSANVASSVVLDVGTMISGRAEAQQDEVIVTSGAEAPDIITPVELIQFSGEVREEQVVLAWSTATETNNEGFHLYKSVDGVDFLEIAFIEGNGNTNKTSDYTFVDPDPVAGISFYKLVQKDYDGMTEDLGTILIEYVESIGALGMECYPNPFHDYLKINARISLQGTSVMIYDVSGKMASHHVIDEHDDHRIDLRHLPSGLYQIYIETVAGIVSERVIKR